MLKKDLIDQAAERAGLTQEQSRKAIDAIQEVVLASLARGRSVMLLGLGKLVITRRGAKRARNLRTGEAVTVPARNAALLRPSDALVRAVNEAPLQ